MSDDTKLKVVSINNKKPPETPVKDDSVSAKMMDVAKDTFSCDTIIIGREKNGTDIHIMTTCNDKTAVVYMLECAKLSFISGD